VRLVVEREREIRTFIPDEYWAVTANFSLSIDDARRLGPEWVRFLSEKDEKGNPPTLKSQNAWLGGRKAIKAELVDVAGEKFEVRSQAGKQRDGTTWEDLTPRIMDVARAAGMTGVKAELAEDADGKGPARFRRTVTGTVDPATPYSISAIETKRTTTRPSAPYITSSLQQAASSRLGFGAQRTMRAAQQLYEGVDVPGEGPVGLITYMRTDSTHISGEALSMARDYIGRTFGDKYLPEKPNFFSSSNKAAQEAHEAIRPTNVALSPSRVRSALTPDQFRLYQIIWERFVSCQMVPAQWDSTTVLITGGRDAKKPCTFRASGRILIFDGFYKASGVPMGGDEQNLPRLTEQTKVSPFAMDLDQKFTAPPPRYSEASLIKMLESEGIGRPSTYA